jgi:FkbM family methyltransferase
MDLPATPDPAAPRALLALGARAVGLVEISNATAGGGVPATQAIGPLEDEDAGLFAVTVVVEVSAGMVAVRLMAADGTVLDESLCAERPQPYDLALLTSPGRRPDRVDLVPRTEGPQARLLAMSIFSFAPRLATASYLMHRRNLVPDPGWSRVYGLCDPEDAAARLRERIFNGLTAPAAVPWIEKLSVLLEPGDELSRALLISGLYEPETMIAMRNLLPRGGTFLDVGAHCGMYTLFAARCAGNRGRVIAFEPSAREFARLSANVALNRLANVETHRVAISDEPGMTALRIAEPGHAGHNTLGARFAYEGVRLDHMEPVAATTFDAVLQSSGLTRCDMIKMDIEGAELRALKGGETLFRRFRPVLILEVFDAALAANGASVEELVATLGRLGYTFHDIDPDTAELTPAATIDGVLSNNIVALPVS